jgi:hypothetical protein
MYNRLIQTLGVKRLNEPGMVAYTYNPVTKEAEAEFQV